MNNDLIHVNTLPPFKRMCMTIGELPTSYLESMTYYEMLVWFTEYMKNTVIPTINNNGEAVEELQGLYIQLKSFVDNYFDNLDVQDEINNKLDDMAESGQLTDIIAQYLGLAGILAFDTVGDMKAAINLVNGSKCCTLGFHSVNDGGAAYYKIREINNSDVIDEMRIISITNSDNLIAELITNKTLNIKQFGAYGDNEHDDSNVFKTVFKYLSDNLFYDASIVSDYTFKFIIDIPTGNYLIKQSNLLSEISNTPSFNLLINGNMSKLIFDEFSGNAFQNNNLWGGIEFKNITFLSTSDDNDRILFYNTSSGKTQNLKFINCIFSGTWDKVIRLIGSNNNSEYLFEYCSMNGTWKNFMLIDNDGSDQFVNYWFNNCKYWSSSNWIHFKKGGQIKLNNCDISGYQPSNDTYLFILGSGTGSSALSTPTFIDNGSRYEIKNEHAKIINCNWNHPQIIFNGSDFSALSSQVTPSDEVFKFILADAYGIVNFEKCNLFGKFYIKTDSNANVANQVKISNSIFYGINEYNLSNIATLDTSYTYSPLLVIENCKIQGSQIIYNSIFRKNNEPYPNNTMMMNKTYSFNSNTTQRNTVMKKYYKPYYIKNVYISNMGRTYDRNIQVTITSLLGKVVSSLSTTQFTVSTTEWTHFLVGMEIIVNNTKVKITGVSYNGGNPRITVDNAVTVNANDDIKLVLIDVGVNPYYGPKMIENNSCYKLFDDLVINTTEILTAEIFYECME